MSSADQTEDIRIGDQVHRKNGLGPRMYVFDLTYGYTVALCNWFVGHRMFKDAAFVSDLRRVPSSLDASNG